MTTNATTYDLRISGAPYGNGSKGEALDTAHSLGEAERIARKALNRGQRVTAYEDGEPVATWELGEDGEVSGIEL